MAETNTQSAMLFEYTALTPKDVAPKDTAMLVASALIILAGEDFGAPLVTDLSDVPTGAHVVVTSSHDNDFFTLPGGKKDDTDFDILAACAREVHEELGIIIDPNDLVETDNSVMPAQNDPSQTIDITTLHVRSIQGGIFEPHAEIREVRLIPINGHSPVPLSDVLAHIVLPSLRVA